MGTKYLFLFLLFLQTTLSAQAPGALWIKSFTGEGKQYGWSVIETSDGYYLMAGSSYNKLIFIKTDTSGNLIWKKTYDTSNSGDGLSLIETSDHNFLAAAEKSLPSRMNDAWLLLLDSAGDTIWTRTYGTESPDRVNCIIQTAGGGFFLAGETTGSTSGWKSWMLKINNIGEIQWEKVIASDYHNGTYTAAGTADGGYLLSGYIFTNPDNLDSYFIKVDSSGNIEWTKSYGNTNWEQASSVQSLDNGFITLSLVENISTYSRSLWVKRLSETGDTIWTKRFDGGAGLYAGYVQLTTDNSFLLSGNLDSAGINNSYLYLAKLNQYGSIIWSQTYGNGKIVNCSLPVETTGDNYLITGTQFIGENNTDILLIKTDPDPWLPTRIEKFFAVHSGRTIELTWLTSHQKNCRGFQIEREEGNLWKNIYFIEGDGNTNDLRQYTYTDTLLNVMTGSTLKYRVKSINYNGSLGYSKELEVIITVDKFDLRQNYPNPFNSITNIEFTLRSPGYTNLKIYNILGEETVVLFNQEAEAGYYRLKWNAAEFPAGVYIYKLTSNESSITKKLVHLK